MRIGIDGRELLGRPTGVGRYLANLCAEWTGASAYAGHELIVYAPRPVPSGAHSSATPRAGARLTAATVPGAGGFWWEQRALARRAAGDRLDVFFGPGYSVPLALDVPAIVTLHDVSFFARPEWFGWREGPRRRWLAIRAAAAARTVVTVSEFSRREIVSHLNTPPARVRVVHNGVAAPAGTEPPRALPPPAASGAPLVLYVGALFARRRLPMLIAAFEQVARAVPGVELAIVGPDRTWPPEDLHGIAAAHGVASRVAFLSYVDDAELAALYRRASVFAWLSEYEGFGLTPLEALAAGTAVVAGDTAVAREIYGNAVRHVPVNDPGAVAAALVEVITRRDVRETLLAQAGPLLARYTWTRAAAETLAVLRDAAAQLP
jgi:glycosyltransferase involved in cell wall biosynthesis